MATQLSGKEISDLTQDECLRNNTQRLQGQSACNCRAHRILKEIKNEDIDLANLLASLNELDVHESFKDQSGAQCLTDIELPSEKTKIAIVQLTINFQKFKSM